MLTCFILFVCFFLFGFYMFVFVPKDLCVLVFISAVGSDKNTTRPHEGTINDCLLIQDLNFLTTVKKRAKQVLLFYCITCSVRIVSRHNISIVEYSWTRSRTFCMVVTIIGDTLSYTLISLWYSARPSYAYQLYFYNHIDKHIFSKHLHGSGTRFDNLAFRLYFEILLAVLYFNLTIA